MQNISHDRLLDLVEYNPDTGRMVWRRPTSRRVKVGGRAGSLAGNGYWQIKLDGRVYNYHRVVWFYVTGAWPDRWIDHKNRDTADNRFCNLRLSTISQNGGNRKLQSTSSIGLKGVQRNRHKFIARVTLGGIRHHLGTFDTAEAAHAAYFAGAQRLFGEFARAA